MTPLDPLPSRLSGTVLVVEDNPVNRIIAEEMLESLGLDCIEAQDGVEALDVLSRRAVDLVLMDCQMPVMDGYAATRAIRELEQRGLRARPASTPHARGSGYPRGRGLGRPRPAGVVCARRARGSRRLRPASPTGSADPRPSGKAASRAGRLDHPPPADWPRPHPSTPRRLRILAA